MYIYLVIISNKDSNLHTIANLYVNSEPMRAIIRAFVSHIR